MKKPSAQGHDYVFPNQGRGETSRKFRGTRLRKWGRWVSEIRMPKCRAKLWLGSYKTAEQAARAYDAAAYYLKRPAAHFNFPDSVSLIPPVSSHSPKQIKNAAAKYALGELTSTSPSLHSNNKQQPAIVSPLQSSSVSEMEISSDQEALWKSLFAGTDGAEGLNLDKFAPINEEPAPASDLLPHERYNSVDPTQLWNLRRLTFW